MKTATLKQAKKVLELLEDVLSEQLQGFLESGLFSDLLAVDINAIDREEFRRACGLSVKDLKIATVPFDPMAFIGERWQEIAGEQDERSVNLPEVDFAKVRFVRYLKKGESSIKREEFLRRLKETDDIRLGTTVFMGLWNDYEAKRKDSVIEHLYQEGKIKNWLYFFGSIILGPDGDRGVLYLYRRGDGEWRWSVDWLESDWDTESLSAVLPQV